jgi:stringent starvation protein B
MSEGVLPPKRDVADALLSKGSLFVHLDPRVDGVCVPQWLTQQPQLVLQVGLQMAVRIPDLRVDEDGVFGTLSFNRSPFACHVPWASVFALVGDDGRGLVWPESMPPEIAAEVEREAQRARRGSEDRAQPMVGDKADAERGLRLAQPSAAARALADAEPSVASLVGTAHREIAQLPRKPRVAPQRASAKRKSLPPYLRVVK